MITLRLRLRNLLRTTDANATLDMTQGAILPLLFRFCLPILFGNLIQQLYNMVDAAVVGKFVSTGALAAVGATGSITFMVIGFADGLCAGLCIPIAQSFGAKDHAMLRRCVAHAFLLAIVFAAVLTVSTSLGLRWILESMHTPDDIFADSYIYLRLLFLGLPATLFYNLNAYLLRALGNSRTPLFFLLVASFLNIVLDLVFVLCFHWDVAGVGLATVIAQLLSALGCFVYMIRTYPALRPTRAEWKPSGAISARMLLSGLPMALQYSITAIGSILLQAAVNSLGSLYVAAMTAATKVQNIVILPCNTLGTTLATWCGQNRGARQYNRIRAGVRCGMWMMLVYSIGMGALMFFWGKYITLLFLSAADPDLPLLLSLAEQCLRWNALFYPALCQIFVFRFSLQGLEHSMLAMIAGLYELAARGGVAQLAAPVYGYTAICLASPVAWVAACLLLIPAYLCILPRLRRSLAEPPAVPGGNPTEGSGTVCS